MKTFGIGSVVAAVVGAALYLNGYEVAGMVVGLGGAVVASVWHKLLGKLGVRSPR